MTQIDENVSRAEIYRALLEAAGYQNIDTIKDVRNAKALGAVVACRTIELQNNLASDNARLREALSSIVEAWDWWQVDPYDRCQSVPSDAINEARAALAEKGEK